MELKLLIKIVDEKIGEYLNEFMVYSFSLTLYLKKVRFILVMKDK